MSAYRDIIYKMKVGRRKYATNLDVVGDKIAYRAHCAKLS